MTQKKPRPPDLPDFDVLFEHCSEGILMLAEGGRRILDVNPKAAELLGRDREELLHKDLGDFLSEELQDLTAFSAAVINHGVGWLDEISWPGGDGSTNPVRISASGFESSMGRFVLLIIHETSTERDTERRAVAAAVEEATSEFIAQLRAFQVSVLNDTSHEFRTPLTPIIIQTALLERNLAAFLSADDRKAFEMIRRNLEQIDESVGRIVAAGEQRMRE